MCSPLSPVLSLLTSSSVMAEESKRVVVVGGDQEGADERNPRKRFLFRRFVRFLSANSRLTKQEDLRDLLTVSSRRQL